MAILPSLPEPTVKQFYLPSTANLPEDQQLWVQLDISPMNVRDSLVAELGDTPMRTTLRVLAERIRDWNGTEENGTPIPINADTILRLGETNLNYLASQIAAPVGAVLTTDQKKS